MKNRSALTILRFWNSMSILCIMIGGLSAFFASTNEGPIRILLIVMTFILIITGFLILGLKLNCPYCGKGIHGRTLEHIRYCPGCGRDLEKPYDTRIHFDR